MKNLIGILMGGAVAMIVSVATAQKVDEARMTRDIAVAENILSTLIKQEYDKRSFFPVEVKGTYQSGYGVILNVPSETLTTLSWGQGGNRDMVVLDGAPGAFTFTWTDGDQENVEKELERELARSEKELSKAEKEVKASKAEKEARGIARAPRASMSIDSAKALSNAKLIQAAKNFVLDYGDMISQLAPDERIVITNRNEGQFRFYGASARRSLLSVETMKSDLTQFKQGKISREQLLAKIKVTNTTSSGKVEPDIELLTSIFNRLYRSDLSKTYYLDGNTYYDRLNDYGAIVYMQVFSSSQLRDGLYNMPTVNLREVDQATRDKKVKELFPLFESELKDNILEYGRTVKSLGDNEQLVFNVKLTRCKGCGIPSDIELTVKNSVLKDYNAGKIDKKNALSKITVKNGPIQ
jgi:hypothetical protein